MEFLYCQIVRKKALIFLKKNFELIRPYYTTKELQKESLETKKIPIGLFTQIQVLRIQKT